MGRRTVTTAGSSSARSNASGRRPSTPVRTGLILVVLLGLLAGGAVVAVRTGVISTSQVHDGPLAVRPTDAPGSDGAASGAAGHEGEERTYRPFGPPVLRESDAPKGKPPSAKGIEQVIGQYVGKDALGKHHAVSVRDVSSGKVLYSRNGGKRFIPASTTKLFTAAAVLDAYGPEHRFHTTVELDTSTTGNSDGASGKQRPPRITVVGGGDPLLATEQAWRRREDAVRDRRYPVPATVDELAADAAKQLTDRGIDRVRLDVDDTLFREAVAPSWESQYVPTGVVSPIHALWVDSGRLDWPYSSPRSEDPALGAAESFARALKDAGVRVTDIERGKAPGDEDTERLAKVSSARLSDLVTHALLLSDNDTAEVLARHVALARDEPATFAGTGEAVRDQVAEAGVDVAGVRLHDGSGLSRNNRIPPNALTQLLAIASDADHPQLRGVLTGMPVGGFSGSLADRFTGPGGSVGVGEDGAGLVRAKVGSLNQVASLAGVVETADGRQLAFDIVSDRGAPIDPRIGIDRAAAALTGCGCR